MARGEEIPKTNPAGIEKLIEQIREMNLEPGVLLWAAIQACC